jgi:hypothetical protein
MKRFSTIILAISLYTIYIAPGCKKTTYEQQKMPYNNIESFVVMGYAGDSINASIKSDEIIIYWAAEAPLPATIKPTFVVSAGATVSPASGTEVAFNSTTAFTVTAEDGTEKTYKLKPAINKAIPRISAISPGDMLWLSSPQLTVSGEYFLTGSARDVKVYAERMRDGFEFDLTVDQSKLTMTNISATLPVYTDIMDTGLHKIRVKIGDRVSDEKQVRVRFPDIQGTNMVQLTFEEAGRTLAAGDSMTLKIWDNYNGAVTKWYMKKFTKLVMENYVFEASALSQTDTYIRFKLPATPIVRKPSNVILYYPGPHGATYWGKILNQSAWPIIPVQN